jgi:hypothetical protein
MRNNSSEATHSLVLLTPGFTLPMLQIPGKAAPHTIGVANPESSTPQRCRAFNDVVVGDNGDGVQHQQGSPFPSTCPNAFVAGHPQLSDAYARHQLTRLLQHLAMTL